MSDMLFLFTFSPVQSFIAEARRGQDLFAGSQILSELARAALHDLQQIGAKSIYPVTNSAHMPNKLVLSLAAQKPEAAGQAAEQAIHRKWLSLAQQAYEFLKPLAGGVDSTFQQIWDRQLKQLWECHWVAVPFDGRSYGDVYREANRLLDAVKRCRAFTQTREDGMKDTLSGRRSALHTASLEPKAYWSAVSKSPNVTRAQLRPDGKERLDAVGCVKRFGLDLVNIPSVNTAASADFLAQARTQQKDELDNYRKVVEQLLSGSVHRVRSDCDWPYDGDLFYAETLTPERMIDSYGVNLTEQQLKPVRDALSQLVKAVHWKPSVYYALLALDGDNMGKRIDQCTAPEHHKFFSNQVSQFAQQAPKIIERHQGYPVYVGGDDVLAFLPLSTAIAAAVELADEFHTKTGNTASAGLAFAHVLQPLGLALNEARRAEADAKRVTDKHALAVRALKRSGEVVHAVCKMEKGSLSSLNDLVDAFRCEVVSPKLAYDVRACAPVFTDAVRAKAFGDIAVSKAAFRAEIKRLTSRHIQRHAQQSQSQSVANVLINTLQTWSNQLDNPTALANWMILARFIAQRGEE